MQKKLAIGLSVISLSLIAGIITCSKMQKIKNDADNLGNLSGSNTDSGNFNSANVVQCDNPLGGCTSDPIIKPGTSFESLLRTAGDCGIANCPSGAYYIQTSDDLNTLNEALIKQGQIDGPAAWENNRYALLIKKGTYTIAQNNPDVVMGFNLGFFTQILGLDLNPMNVNISPGVEVFNQCNGFWDDPICKVLGALNNFWRGIENINMTGDMSNDLRFAASQAAPIRRINISRKNFVLCDWYGSNNDACGNASGGFMANSRIEQTFIPGSQQQWLLRNSTSAQSRIAIWNMVYLGDNINQMIFDPDNVITPHRAPAGSIWGGRNGFGMEYFPISTIQKTPENFREKPFIFQSFDTQSSRNIWQIAYTNLKRSPSSGNDWDNDVSPSESLKIDDNVYILAGDPNSTFPTAVSAAHVQTINQQLANGKSLIIMPGTYNLEDTLNVTKNNTIILGIGLPSLVCITTKPCMKISAEEGVQLAGVTFDAGYQLTKVLLQLGDSKNNQDHSANPNFLYDVFVRVAETQSDDPARPEGVRQMDTGIIIYTNNVVGDNLWLWRADHDKASGKERDNSKNLVDWNTDKGEHGIIVYGDNVRMYGLAVEHFRDYQTIWYGENGEVYFYQSEFPYDVPSLANWVCHEPLNGTTESNVGCVSYLVDKNVKKHHAVGVGIYTFFPPLESDSYRSPNPSAETIVVKSAIKAPNVDGIKIQHIIGRWLNGKSKSGLLNLVSDYQNDCWGFGATCMNVTADSQDVGQCNDSPDLRTSVLDEYVSNLGKGSCRTSMSQITLRSKF